MALQKLVKDGLLKQKLIDLLLDFSPQDNIKLGLGIITINPKEYLETYLYEHWDELRPKLLKSKGKLIELVELMKDDQKTSKPTKRGRKHPSRTSPKTSHSRRENR